MIGRSNIPDKKARKIFNKYVFPIMKPCRTDFQKQNAMGIAKILWLLLITNNDKEERVYEELNKVLQNHDDCISFGSLYYYKMKKSLTDKQINYLRKYYSNIENLNHLIEDEDVIFKF